MNQKSLKKASFVGALSLTLVGITPAAALANPQPPFQLAQTTALTERVSEIGACRGTGTQALTVYTNSGLTTSAGTTVQPNSTVTLTGVFANNSVQIRQPALGWVASGTLKANCGGGNIPPDDLITNFKYCRRIRSSVRDGAAYSYLDNGLVAYDQPGRGQQIGTGGVPDGPAGGAVVGLSAVTPEIQDFDGRRWYRVRYVGVGRTIRTGWVSNGPAGQNQNIANCGPQDQPFWPLSPASR